MVASIHPTAEEDSRVYAEEDGGSETHAPKSRAYRRSADGRFVESGTRIPAANRQPELADPASKFWEETAESAATRMRVNGENLVQMEWAEKEKASGRDHSADEPWEQDASLAWIDQYLKYVFYAALALKGIVLLLSLLLAALLITIPMTIYGAFLPATGDRPARGCGFALVFYVIMPLLALPFGLLTVVSLLYDYAYYYLFGIPLWLARGSPSRASSLEVLAPFCNGPSVWRLYVDFFVCVLGQCTRQGMGAADDCAHHLLSWFELAYQIALMVLAIPSFKYWMNSNPWAFDLKQRYVQQITTTGVDMPPQLLSMTVRRVISRCKQARRLTKLVDGWSFVPHYPYPPPNRRYALGMQQGAKMITVLVHTTHADTEAAGVKEQLVVSGSAPRPVYRVMLWYNNPYHLYTGWVEASCSDGGRSQPDKPGSFEHPMWLVTSRSPMLSTRKGGVNLVGVGFIDAFFDWWLPDFVYSLRFVNFGQTYADAHRTEVVSKDGVSRPAAKNNVLPAPEYEPVEEDGGAGGTRAT